MIVVAAIVLLGALYFGAKALKGGVMSQPSRSTYQGSNRYTGASTMQEDPAVVADDAQDDQALTDISADDADTASLSDTSGL